MRLILSAFLITSVLFTCQNASAQVGIGTTTPNISSVLDITSTTAGLLTPRMTQVQRNAIPAPATGLIIFQTDMTPGFYYYNGLIWIPFSSSDWRLIGNAGTNPATDFIGTIDNQSLVFRTNNIERARFLTNGNVGIGTSAPNYRLDLANGTFGFGNSNTRTETRDNGGLQGNAGAQSGFFETSAPVNYPSGASSWWHLIDSRHSNSANNYALQIAGSFFDQELWFRKTNGSATTPWSRILTTSSGWNTIGNIGTNPTNNFIGTVDVVDFVTRTSNVERMRVTSGGNVGIGIAAPTQKFDVQGGNARINNAFIGDVGHGASWTGFSHQAQNNTTGYGFLQSSDGAFTFINKQNTGSGYIGFRVANNDVAVITNNRNMGIGTTTPTSKLHVIADAVNLPVIYGINTNATAGTTSYGVRGESSSTGLGSAGVSGVSTNGGQNEIGVLGDYSLWGAGVFGLGWAAAYTDMPATRDFGVFGTVNYTTGTGVYGRNTNTTVGSAYGVYSMGNFAVTGAKSASVPTTKGNQLVYCTESPEIWFEDIGGGTLENGQVHIYLDDLFMETVHIDNNHPMRIFIQEEGESNGLIVIKDADNKGFTVKEKNNGQTNIAFSYRILAKRRFYQDHRFGVDANQPFENNLVKAKDVPPATTDPQEMKRFVDQQTMAKGTQGK
ncbi:MAG TPA: hypothetical protein VLB74_07760 [Flavobacterium sp.]|uniref:hypothetical protein n=1 Tax=Flavobacterium sp. TaxID=239 RepID=UPI002C5705E3|nr:hypothetical protein [Flavobacterium sp.]HSD14528.1 hypothetical protein [Flavobacterium sp.]